MSISFFERVLAHHVTQFLETEQNTTFERAEGDMQLRCNFFVGTWWAHEDWRMPCRRLERRWDVPRGYCNNTRLACEKNS